MAGAARTKDGFSFYSTAEEVTEGIDASGKTALITGASSGLGAETARVLAMRGACVVLAVRNVDAGERVKESILQETPKAHLHILHLDLNSMASICTSCDNFKSLKLPLNILIRSPTAKEVQLHKINDKSRFNTWDAYGLSKIANIVHANELARRFENENVNMVANSLHPGLVLDTLIFKHVDMGLVQKMANYYQVSPKTLSQGAASICFVALHPSVESCSGKYFDDCAEGTSNELCKNEKLAKEIWDFSVKATLPSIF